MHLLIDTETATGLTDCLAKYEGLIQDAHRRIELLTKQNEANRLLTIEQACAYLGGINEDTLLYYRERGLAYFKKGKNAIWYRQGDIDDWLATGKVSRHKSSVG